MGARWGHIDRVCCAWLTNSLLSAKPVACAWFCSPSLPVALARASMRRDCRLFASILGCVDISSVRLQHLRSGGLHMCHAAKSITGRCGVSDLGQKAATSLLVSLQPVCARVCPTLVMPLRHTSCACILLQYDKLLPAGNVVAVPCAAQSAKPLLSARPGWESGAPGGVSINSNP